MSGAFWCFIPAFFYFFLIMHCIRMWSSNEGQNPYLAPQFSYSSWEAFPLFHTLFNKATKGNTNARSLCLIKSLFDIEDLPVQVLSSRAVIRRFISRLILLLSLFLLMLNPVMSVDAAVLFSCLSHPIVDQEGHSFSALIFLLHWTGGILSSIRSVLHIRHVKQKIHW